MIVAIKSGVYFRKKNIIGFENWFTSTILHTYSKLIWKCPHFNTKKVDVKKEMLNSGYETYIIMYPINGNLSIIHRSNENIVEKGVIQR